MTVSTSGKVLHYISSSVLKIDRPLRELRIFCSNLNWRNCWNRIDSFKNICIRAKAPKPIQGVTGLHSQNTYIFQTHVPNNNPCISSREALKRKC